MATASKIPFNVDVLFLQQANLRLLTQVTSMDTFVGQTKNFNPEGLYSTTIFGVQGTRERKLRFAYIDLRTPIITPVIYKALLAVKPLYGEILAGKAFATWNPVVKDFVRANALEGRTGFSFFVEYLADLEFPNNETESRQDAVALLTKYRDRMLMRYFLVIPAGYREYERSDDGREMTNEINEFYLSLIGISNTINLATYAVSPQAFDAQRRNMQQRVMDLYDLFSRMVEGKRGVIVGKFASRKVNNGTRNVITSMSTTSARLGDPNNVTMNDTMAGLYQVARALAPLTFYQLRDRFLSQVMSVPGTPAKLCDPQSLTTTRAFLKSEEYSKWLSEEGLETFINGFSDESLRHKPVMVGGYYLGLTYRGPNGTFALIGGVDELPENNPDFLPEHCTPITNAELLYHALYPIARRHYAIVTRYPITGPGSSYPSRIYLKSTISSEVRREIDISTGEPISLPFGVTQAGEFPVLGSPFFNAMSPHGSHLGGLGADFDGDTCSFTGLLTEDAIKEGEDYLKSKRAYVGTDGRLSHSTNIDTVKFVLASLTGP